MPRAGRAVGLYGGAAHEGNRNPQALGASTLDVSWLLIRQLAWPVLLANAPFPGLLHGGSSRHWLDGFAYRIELGPLPFLTAGLGAIAVAVATTAFHALKVASARPVQALSSMNRPASPGLAGPATAFMVAGGVGACVDIG